MAVNKKRIFYLSLFVLLLTVEILIALYVHDNIVRPYIGDVLVVILIYSFLKILFPETQRLPILVTVFAVLVEIMQGFDLIGKLGLSDNTLARIIIGTTFDIKDIACYVAGGAISFVWECMLSGRLSGGGKK